jgi:enoyl-CoA hydratase
MGILTRTSGAVCVITIDRPERRNALDPETYRALGTAFVDGRDDDAVRAFVLTGSGDRAFCAGMDLKAFSAGSAAGSSAAVPGPGAEVFSEHFYPKPIVAAANGAAVGGGFGLALACDLIVAADHAVFGIPEVRRGLVGVGVTSRAALRLPPALVMELALTGEPITAARAYELGVVNRVVAGTDVVSTAIEIATTIASNAPLGVRLAKEVVAGTVGLHDVDISAWRAAATTVHKSEDAAEGARAFLEKRAPRFTGR